MKLALKGLAFLLSGAAVLGVLIFSMPLVLGSWIAFAVFLVYPVVIAVRIRNEEQVLLEGLAGYAAYRQKVKYRILPFIW